MYIRVVTITEIQAGASQNRCIVPRLICPIKSTLFFSGWQKHLILFRAWHPFFSDLPYETQRFLRLPPQKISGAFATLKKWVDFTGRLRFSNQSAD